MIQTTGISEKATIFLKISFYYYSTPNIVFVYQKTHPQSTSAELAVRFAMYKIIDDPSNA